MDQSEYAIRILQWNAQGISTSKEDLLKLISEYEPRVVAIQEKFLAGDVKVKLEGFNCYSKQGSFIRRYHGGIATYLHNSISAQEINIVSLYQIRVVRVNVRKNLISTIANIYLPGSAAVDEAEIGQIIDILREPVILRVDFNGHNTVWGNMNSDRRGKMLEAIFREKQLNIMNNGSATHTSGTVYRVSRRHYLTVVSPGLTADMSWKVLPSPLSSDHYPILLD